jgi:aspartyl protease family protein
MATGFMDRENNVTLSSVAVLLLLSMPFGAWAAEIVVSALFNGKAVITVDGGKPRTLAIGQTSPEGVKLVSATSEAAVIEFGGRRETLTTGSGMRVGAAAGAGSASAQAILRADERGHFYAIGSINGSSVRFLVDTGATTIALSTAEARRLGIDYRSGTRSTGRTANGIVASYGVKLDTVRLGDITLQNVDAHVLDGMGPSDVLLGMSFLNRTQMQRDGDTLVLVKRF